MKIQKFLAEPDLDAESLRQWFQKQYGKANPSVMSSRERVIRALNHQEPDRVPFDFWGVPETWQKLFDFFSLEKKDDLLDLLGVDCRIVSPDYIGPGMEVMEDGRFYNVWGSLRKIVTNEYSKYEEYAAFPLAEASSVAQVEQWDKWPSSDYWDWDSIGKTVEQANKQEPRHIRYDIGGIFETAWGVYGLDNFLIALYEKPEIVCAIMDGYTEIFIENFRRLMSRSESLIDMVYTYDDVATQDGLLMSPDMWRQYILPFHQRLNKVIKEYDVKLIYHSCGSVIPLIEAFRDEMHIDVLNPLQPAAKDMDMVYIKKMYGDSLAFHGGGDLQRTLPFGTVDEVRQEVESLCRTLG
ncbi:uroporphyrinogen decarboxylase family protein, partial [Oceanispirochaeta sp.]|uniref:uroporphyrinogen decarboxylase family protein n=1 Tax=Oceanispirochaeta sp. TaxID=2035350 RepID=UPI00261DE38E